MCGRGRDNIPNNAVHVWFSKHFTGRGCQRTHHLIDSFSSIKGSAHRQWLHTPAEVAAVALSAEGPECIAAGLNHLLIDQIYDDPYQKIVMEMFRLSNKTPAEPALQRGNGCWIHKRN